MYNYKTQSFVKNKHKCYWKSIKTSHSLLNICTLHPAYKLKQLVIKYTKLSVIIVIYFHFIFHGVIFLCIFLLGVGNFVNRDIRHLKYKYKYKWKFLLGVVPIASIACAPPHFFIGWVCPYFIFDTKLAPFIHYLYTSPRPPPLPLPLPLTQVDMNYDYDIYFGLWV
jgi:hypothetical protein